MVYANSATNPDRHSGLECARIAGRIETQAQRVAVMIADGAFGLPRRK
jgi:hypothetical protein